jgi:hypothetical protein
MFTPSFTPRDCLGEWRGEQRISPQRITSPPGDKNQPWGTTSPLESKFAPRVEVKNGPLHCIRFFRCTMSSLGPGNHLDGGACPHPEPTTWCSNTTTKFLSSVRTKFFSNKVFFEQVYGEPIFVEQSFFEQSFWRTKFCRAKSHKKQI